MMAEKQKMKSSKTSSITALLAEQIGRENALSLPRIDRIVVNVGVGRRVVAEGPKSLAPIIKDLERITGQKPVVRLSRKAVASFKLREGLPVGLMVTLRGKRAEDFLTRLVRTALPRTRDFRGVPLKALDKGGNLTIGIREQIIFPEAAADSTGIVFGMEVTIVTTTRDRSEAEILLRALGVPFQKIESAK